MNEGRLPPVAIEFEPLTPQRAKEIADSLSTYRPNDRYTKFKFKLRGLPHRDADDPALLAIYRSLSIYRSLYYHEEITLHFPEEGPITFMVVALRALHDTGFIGSVEVEGLITHEPPFSWLVST